MTLSLMLPMAFIVPKSRHVARGILAALLSKPAPRNVSLVRLYQTRRIYTGLHSAAWRQGTLAALLARSRQHVDRIK
jgi:hypothetical protein